MLMHFRRGIDHSRLIRLGVTTGLAAAVLSCKEVSGPKVIEPPTGITVVLTSPTSARITWTPSLTPDDVSAYRVLRSSVTLGDVTGTTYLDETLQELQTYRYSVLALGYSGESSEPSVESDPLTAPDVTRPLVTSTSPSAGATGVARSARISLTFSETMNAATINATSIVVKAADNSVIAGTWTFVPATRVAEFTPASPLPNSSGVTVAVLTAVADQAGNSLASAFNLSFTVRDELGPTVLSTSLTATGVAVNQPITAVMSEAIDSAGVTTTSVRVIAVAGSTPTTGTVSYAAQARTITFTPTVPLSFEADYNLVIGPGISDVAGNALAAPFTQAFRTADAPVIAPTVTSVFPEHGSASIPVSVAPAVTFSIDMDPMSIGTSQVALRLTSSGEFVSGSVDYTAATRTAKFTPAAPLANATGYTIQVSGVKSAAGTPIAQGVATTFSTAAAADNVAPTVLQTDPVNGATEVNLSASARATFSEPLNALTVNSSTFSVSTGGSPVAGNVSYDATDRVATFTPSSPLTAGSLYTATITTGVSDVAANQLAAPIVFSFTAAQEVDATPPAIVSRAPAPGETGVSLSSLIRVGFNETMNAGTISGATFGVSTAGGADIPGSVSFDAAARVATFTPSSPLANSQSYTVRVASGISDVAGNALSAETWTFTTTAPSDVTPPTIVSRLPAAGATGVTINAVVQVGLSEAMNVSTMNNATFTVSANGSAILGFVVYNPGTQVVAFTPVTPLAYSQTYTVSLTSGIQDLAGNALAASTWTFTTQAPPDNTPPSVTGTTPAAGATDVATNAAITATFSEAMNASTVTSSFTVSAGGSSVAGTVTYDAANRVATFTPNGALSYSTTYTATISTGARDLAGNGLSSSTVFSFTTIAPPDNTPPTVASRSPAPASTGVAINTTVQVGFSEAMKTSSITTSTFTVAAGGTNVPGAVSYDTNTRVATFTPSASLANGQAYTVTLSTGIQDAAGNGLSSADVFSFTTVAAAPTEFIAGQPFFAGATDLPPTVPGFHVHINFTQDGQNIGFSTAVPGGYYFLALNQAGLDAIGPYTPGYTVTGIKTLSGTLIGQQLDFTCTLDNGRVFNFTGTVSGNVITGTFSGETLPATPIVMRRAGS